MVRPSMRLWSFWPPKGAALDSYVTPIAVQSNSDIENGFGGGIPEISAGAFVGRPVLGCNPMIADHEG